MSEAGTPAAARKLAALWFAGAGWGRAWADRGLHQCNHTDRLRAG